MRKPISHIQFSIFHFSVFCIFSTELSVELTHMLLNGFFILRLLVLSGCIHCCHASWFLCYLLEVWTTWYCYDFMLLYTVMFTMCELTFKRCCWCNFKSPMRSWNLFWKLYFEILYLKMWWLSGCWMNMILILGRAFRNKMWFTNTLETPLLSILMWLYMVDSAPSLRYHLQKFHLTRPHVEATTYIEEVIDIISEEVKGPNVELGYKRMSDLLIEKYGKYVPR